MNNIPTVILDKIDTELYRINNHPICIVKEMVYEYFSDLARIEIESPFVSVENNFDRLRIPENHVSRSCSDTFYKDENTVLRTHMTAYLYPLARSESGESKLKYITCGDVFRKDEIDATHYPVFHQIDGFCVVPDDVDVKQDLRNRISGLVTHLFGEEAICQFMEESDYPDVQFPFTVDSFEVNVMFPMNGEMKQLEVLGAGTVHPDIMAALGLPNHKAWAFGMGVERLAMVMFDIPDIRLFWTKDKRFLEQFTPKTVTKFKPYSKYEMCYKDMSFYTSDIFTYNDLCSIARDEDPKDLIESIILIDEFEHKGRMSMCYRVTYRSTEGNLKNAEVDQIQNSIRKRLVDELQVELR